MQRSSKTNTLYGSNVVGVNSGDLNSTFTKARTTPGLFPAIQIWWALHKSKSGDSDSDSKDKSGADQSADVKHYVEPREIFEIATIQ